VKRSLIPVRGHKGFREKDDVANHTNVSSAKVARYNNLLADFIAGNKIPALKPVLSGCHADMNSANERLVRATNEYLTAIGGDDGLKVHRAHATPARTRPTPPPSTPSRTSPPPPSASCWRRRRPSRPAPTATSSCRRRATPATPPSSC
jgi:hypothetical protein